MLLQCGALQNVLDAYVKKTLTTLIIRIILILFSLLLLTWNPCSRAEVSAFSLIPANDSRTIGDQSLSPKIAPVSAKSISLRMSQVSPLPARLFLSSSELCLSLFLPIGMRAFICLRLRLQTQVRTYSPHVMSGKIPGPRSPRKTCVCDRRKFSLRLASETEYVFEQRPNC